MGILYYVLASIYVERDTIFFNSKTFLGFLIQINYLLKVLHFLKKFALYYCFLTLYFWRFFSNVNKIYQFICFYITIGFVLKFSFMNILRGENQNGDKFAPSQLLWSTISFRSINQKYNLWKSLMSVGLQLGLKQIKNSFIKIVFV